LLGNKRLGCDCSLIAWKTKK
jgi:hypothetical protein